MKNERFNYFQAFVNFSKKACEAAEMLNAFFIAFHPENVLPEMDRIHKIEHEADEIKHSVIEHLSREFVSPLEREDILSLVSEFDDVVDSIDEVIRRVGMYKVQTLRSDVLPFTDLLTKGCGRLCEASTEFMDFKRSKLIHKRIVEINRIESDADTLHFNAISSLFASPNDAMTIMIWQSLYEALEDCFDSCEHVVEVMEGVILKNS